MKRGLLFFSFLLTLLTGCSSSKSDLKPGSKIEVDNNNIMSLIYVRSYGFPNSIPVGDINIRFGTYELMDVNATVNIEATFYLKTEITTFVNESYHAETYYSKLKFSVKSDLKSEDEFKNNKEFNPKVTILENTYNGPTENIVQNFGPDIYDRQFNILKADGYAVLTEKLFGLYTVNLDIDNYFDYFSFVFHKKEIDGQNFVSLDYFDLGRSRMPYLIRNLELKFTYRTYDESYDVTSEEVYEFKTSLWTSLIDCYNFGWKIPFKTNQRWNIELSDISGTAYLRSTYIYSNQ